MLIVQHQHRPSIQLKCRFLLFTANGKKRRRRWRRKRDTKERRRSIFGLLRRHTEREEHSIVLKMFLIKAKSFPHPPPADSMLAISVQQRQFDWIEFQLSSRLLPRLFDWWRRLRIQLTKRQVPNNNNRVNLFLLLLIPSHAPRRHLFVPVEFQQHPGAE